jgi:U3 small nucleolar RNA-associated protein 12
MLKVHQRQVVSSGQLRKVLEDVRVELQRRLKREKEELGFNLAGLRVLGRRVVDEAGEREFVDGRADEGGLAAVATGTKKRAFVNVA